MKGFYKNYFKQIKYRDMDKERFYYYNKNTLFVINSMGKMRVLYTPFRVISQVSLGLLPANTHLYVDEVFCKVSGELYYCIFENTYSYKHFVIPINY